MRQSWYTALSDAEAHFRQLLTSQASEWKRLSNSLDGSSSKQKGKARVSSVPELTDVIVHRNSTKGGEDVFRMVLDIPTGEEQISLEPWKAVLTTPELRQEWDPAVEDTHLVEVFDLITRISKTNYTLGWPAKYANMYLLSWILLTYLCVVHEIQSLFLAHSTTLRHLSTLPRRSQDPQMNLHTFGLHPLS